MTEHELHVSDQGDEVPLQQVVDSDDAHSTNENSASHFENSGDINHTNLTTSLTGNQRQEGREEGDFHERHLGGVHAAEPEGEEAEGS